MVLSAVDNYQNNPQWRLVSEKDKSSYLSRKYTCVTQREIGWRIGRALGAIFLLFQQKAFWKALSESYSGFEVRKVRLRKLPELLPPLFAEANALIDPKAPPKLVKVENDQEILALQSKIERSNPKYEPLLLSRLNPQLLPRYKMELGRATYYFSRPFNISTEGQKFGCIALVEIDGKIHARLTYRSASQATWRTMPATQKTRGEDGFELGRFGKGLIESDTELPIAVTMALQDHLRERSLSRWRDAPNILRTALDYTSDYLNSVCLKAFCKIQEGAADHFIKNGVRNMHAPDPKAIGLPPEDQLPDFSKPLNEPQRVKDDFYVVITPHIYPSKNGQLHYLFHEVKGRVYLAGIEKVVGNPINSFGVRKEAFETKGMDAPLMEYKDQVPHECESEQIRGVPSSWLTYISNWNYVRDLEIIKLYYSAHNLPLPERD